MVGGLTARSMLMLTARSMLMLACGLTLGLTAPVGVVAPEGVPIIPLTESSAIPEGVVMPSGSGSGSPEALREASAAWACTLLTHFSL